MSEKIYGFIVILIGLFLIIGAPITKIPGILTAFGTIMYVNGTIWLYEAWRK